MKNLLQLCLLSLLSLLVTEYGFAQCEIAVDKDNTHVVWVDNSYMLRTVIHHPDRGNQNAASDVKVFIQMPPGVDLDNDITRVRFSINDIQLNTYTYNQNRIIISDFDLERFELLEIEILFNFACIGNSRGLICISVFPGEEQFDFNYENNIHSEFFKCQDSGIGVNPINDSLELPFDIPIPIPEICKYVLDCSLCGGDYLCAGQNIVFPIYKGIKGIYILREGKVVSKSLLKKGKHILEVPENYSANDNEKYEFMFVAN